MRYLRAGWIGPRCHCHARAWWWLTGSVQCADLLLVLDGGAAVERGSHDELLALGGRYAAWVRRLGRQPIGAGDHSLGGPGTQVEVWHTIVDRGGRHGSKARRNTGCLRRDLLLSEFPRRTHHRSRR